MTRSRSCPGPARLGAGKSACPPRQAPWGVEGPLVDLAPHTLDPTRDLRLVAWH